MDTPKNKIAFYAQRSFSEKMNVSFDFIKENWKPLLKYSTYFILPLCLLQALSLNGILKTIFNPEFANNIELDTFGGEMAAFWLHYVLSFLFSYIGSIIIGAVIYGLIKTYNDRPGGLENITLSELWPLFLSNAGRLLLQLIIGFFLMLFVWGLIFVLGFLVSWLTLLLTIPLFLIIIVPLMLWAPVYLYERIDIFSALGKAFRLGFATWGGVFAIMFIMGIIANVLQGVISLPWGISFAVSYLFTLSEFGGSGDLSIGANFMNYIFAVMMTYGIYISMILVLVGISYQYSHANEKVSNISVESDIENFEQL
ncbi:MAG: hypothetical protein LUH22_08545 [Bacteroides sp.]|nr:hypothetical protein [Bacteroides sp.]